MTLRHDPVHSRRAFLRFLAGSPLLAFAGLHACTLGREKRSTSTRDLDQLIRSSDDAINVFDFEAVARNNLPPAHFGYMATGVDDDATLRANREGYGRLYVRPRREGVREGMAIFLRSSVDPLSGEFRAMARARPSELLRPRTGQSSIVGEGRTVELSCDAGPHGRYSPPPSGVWGALDTDEDFMTRPTLMVAPILAAVAGSLVLQVRTS